MWNKNEVDGKVDQAKGKAKQVVGNLTNDQKLKDEGAVDEAVGKAQSAVGTVQKKVGTIVEEAGKSLKG